MGRFTKTSYTKTVDSLVQATKGALKNPYYLYSDKKPTKVTYYKQNLERSTLDPDSGLNYSHIGEQSPIKFNKILDFYLYGIEQIGTNLDVGEFGLEADAIEGTCVVLPNTIRPSMGDYFKIDQITNVDILFRVNAVNMDTLDNGSNAYEISYKLERTKTSKDIESQVVSTYRFLMDNVGTDFKCLVTDETVDLVNKIDDMVAELTKAYQIFFDPRFQNFVYHDESQGCYMYDPYLIEFMIRNKLMSGSENYVYVHQGCALPHTFSYEYSRSIFAMIEDPSARDKRIFYNMASATLVKDINSLFITTLDKVFMIMLNDPNKLNKRFPILPPEVIDRLNTGESYCESDFSPMRVWNLLIAYFRGDNNYLTEELSDTLKYADYLPNKDFYYMIPISIFILNKYADGLMVDKSNTSTL